VLLGAPVPEGFDDFDHETGLADMLLPFLFAPSLDHWILGGGPSLLLPTSTEDAFGRQQWGLGPAFVVGYKTKQFTAVVFPNYLWGIADRGDHRAGSGNHWNVPLGPFVSKTLRFGRTPVKLQLSAEYSLVHQDDFGQRAQIKFAAIPVIPGLVQKPIFGGR
jgi:hypothetical protein